MSYTDEFHKQAYFGDLYELTIHEAAERIHEGLWNSEQATVSEIENAIIDDIERGNLKLVRGNIHVIGKYNNNPPILNALDLASWAEKNGLELESNGAWSSYIHEEAELSLILSEKLEALRALKRSGKTISEIINHPDIKAEAQDEQITKLFLENIDLKSKLTHLTEDQQRINPKSLTSLYIMISTMAVTGYGYNWLQMKSPAPVDIANDAKDILEANIDPETIKKWLHDASKAHPPKANTFKTKSIST
jgi:hypothetical protein